MKNANSDLVRNLLGITTFINQKRLVGENIENNKNSRSNRFRL
jgi:hypothetical protein